MIHFVYDLWIEAGYPPLTYEVQPLERDRYLAELENETMSNDQATDRMMKWFAYSHLPQHLQEISKPFGDLAQYVCNVVESGPERTVALRKLLEAKDAAVRAKLNPGG